MSEAVDTLHGALIALVGTSSPIRPTDLQLSRFGYLRLSPQSNGPLGDNYMDWLIITLQPISCFPDAVYMKVSTLHRFLHTPIWMLRFELHYLHARFEHW